MNQDALLLCHNMNYHYFFVLTVDLSKSSESEVHRMYDAWIPSDSTKRFITQAFTTAGRYTMSSDKSLRPRLAMADTQVGAKT